MRQYVAFFRGLNVSGNNLIKMQDLKKTLESIGCSHIKTVLASGNVLFTAPQDTPKTLQQKIEASLKKSHRYNGTVILRPLEDVFSIEASNPFASIKITPQTRLYVTFLPAYSEQLPKETHENFSIIHSTGTEIFSVVTLSPNKGTVEAMKVLDDTYGKTITTRNWNTLLKVVQLAAKTT